MSKYFERNADSFEEEVEESGFDDNNNSTQPSTSQPLTQEQVDRMENNRKRALEIRKNKEETSAKIAKLSQTMKPSSNKKQIDTGAGFYLDEEDLIEEQSKKVTKLPPAPLPDQQLLCERCRNKFAHSYLSLNFELHVCDGCRTGFPDDYELITKTDAKAEFLLKDCDFDFREPPLKYVAKKHTNYKKYGEMKLYLRFQCRDRALLVHESEENIEDKKEIKEINLIKTRQKNYEKKIKELRKQTRQPSKKLVQTHVHEYGEEKYDKKKDVNYKICTTCSYRLEYEEM